MPLFEKLDLQKLRNRARSIIYLQIIRNILSIFQNGINWNKPSNIIDYTSDQSSVSNIPKKENWQVLITLVTCAIFLLANIYVLIGISKNKHKLLLPWLIIDGILLVLSYICWAIIMYLTSSTEMIVAISIGFLFGVIDILVWLLIFELYRRLKESVYADTTNILGDVDQNNSNPPTLIT